MFSKELWDDLRISSVSGRLGTVAIRRLAYIGPAALQEDICILLRQCGLLLQRVNEASTPGKAVRVGTGTLAKVVGKDR